MKFHQETLAIPRALRETLEKGRAEYQALVRETRWGEGPIYVVTADASEPAGLTAAYAFESLLGWPVVVRAASIFSGYSLPLLKPRSVLLLISPRMESEELLEFARLARSRGAILLVLTADPQSALAQLAHGIFLIRTAGSSDPAVIVTCQHAALSFLGTVAARLLRPPQPQIETLEREFGELPGHAEWALTQLPDALRSLWAGLEGQNRLRVVGGGFYHPPALQVACRLEGRPGLWTSGEEISVCCARDLKKSGLEGSILFLSGSRCRARKQVHEAASRLKALGSRVFSVTDRGDRELVERSDVAVLLPVLTENVGSVLSLSILEWLAARGDRKAGTKRSQGSGPPSG